MSFNNSCKKFRIFVIRQAYGPPLLGRDFFTQFNLNISELNSISLNKVQYLINKFGTVFDDTLGTFNKGYISIKLKSEKMEPKFFRPRPLPFAMKEKVELELNRLLKLGVIEPVNYSPWGTPIVPVLKKDNSIRICGDFKVTLNPNIEIDQYPLPRINELFVKLQGGVQFSKLDLSSAYQQILLDKDSKKLTTISTHKGLFQYTRAPFGIASIPAKFQKIMDSLLQGLDGVIVFLDDILITGKDKSEHLIHLEQVLNILQNTGLKISKDKCSFFCDEICYLGFVINKFGLHPSENKIEAIAKAPIPQNTTQLKAFLGLINYYGQFVSKLSTILSPLYELLKSETVWKWTDNCQESFNKIKSLLSSAPILVHYDSSLPVKLFTDASDYGVGGVISHVMSNGNERPIAFASRTLSDSEKRMSQIEKEGLAIIFCLSKFNQYLYGRKFTLLIDNKALTTIFIQQNIYHNIQPID
ncbi:hypothetical protein WA026_016226 [Henosepilachna vigintioctopunctata]|uniref:RNA-directed DNA polymerase n=1 Tax=Henosepilachna vigintioctopunctata TaxID=420089 RepID=A0AAW1TU09_9CUCU